MVMTARDRRLRELRAGDTIGLYAKDGPTTAHDPQDHLSITVDAVNDVTSVLVEDLGPDLRSTSALQSALDLAFRAVIRLKLADPAAQAVAGPSTGPRPQVAQLQRRTLPPLTDRRPPSPAQAAAVGRPERRPRRNLHAVGHSRNECVSVQLSPGAGTGTLSIDQGWLRRATPTTLSNAITEAFASAYRERERA